MAKKPNTPAAFTVSASLHTKVSKDGTRPVYIRYYHGGTSTRLALSEKVSLSLKQWDKKNQLPSLTAVNGEHLRQVVRDCVALAERVASAALDLSPSHIKEQYGKALYQCLNQISIEAARVQRERRRTNLDK